MFPLITPWRTFAQQGKKSIKFWKPRNEFKEGLPVKDSHDMKQLLCEILVQY